jgi:hypothetical protein
VTGSSSFGVEDLAEVQVTSGVSLFDGKPFCTVRSIAASGLVMLGQLTVAEVRGLALNWLEAAEAAESDAAVVAQLREMGGLPDEVVAAFVAGLRARRAG